MERIETALARLTCARRDIAAAKSIDEVREIRDKTAAVQSYLKARGESFEIQNDCAEIKIRCERRIGEMLAEMDKNKGAATRSHDVTASEGPPTLSDLGIERMQSHRWQQIAGVPDKDFEGHIADTRAIGDELTTAGVLLLYLFMDSGELYVIDFQRLKAWANGPSVNGATRRIEDFRLKQQSKYCQMNDTWGHCVSIETIRREVGLRQYSLRDFQPATATAAVNANVPNGWLFSVS